MLDASIGNDFGCYASTPHRCATRTWSHGSRGRLGATDNRLRANVRAMTPLSAQMLYSLVGPFRRNGRQCWAALRTAFRRRDNWTNKSVQSVWSVPSLRQPIRQRAGRNCVPASICTSADWGCTTAGWRVATTKSRRCGNRRRDDEGDTLAVVEINGRPCQDRCDAPDNILVPPYSAFHVALGAPGSPTFPRVGPSFDIRAPTRSWILPRCNPGPKFPRS